jgi:hypothetical protein
LHVGQLDEGALQTAVIHLGRVRGRLSRNESCLFMTWKAPAPACPLVVSPQAKLASGEVGEYSKA